MPHLAMNFPTSKREVVTVYVDQRTAKEYNLASLKVVPMLQSWYKASVGSGMINDRS